MLRIRAYFFILLFCFTKSYAQTDGYNLFDIFVSNVISENQLNHIVRDNNGFYWLQTSSGRIIRWDGIKFEIIDSITGQRQPTNESYHYQYNPGNKIIFVGNNKQVLYVDSISHLRLMPNYKAGFKAPNLYRQSYAVIKESWDSILKNNNKSVFDRFYQSYYFDKATFRYTTEATGFYQFDSRGIQYYNAGKIKDVAPLTHLPPFILAVDSALLLFNEHTYDVYRNGEKIASSPHKFNLSGDRFQKTGVWFVQRNGSSSFFVLKDSIYKAELRNSQVVFTLVFVLKNRELYKRFYIDELAGRVFLLPENGGLHMLEKKQYALQKIGQSASENIIYALNKENNKLTTNQFFQNLILNKHNKIFEYKNVSPIVYSANKYFYFINDTAYIFSTQGKLFAKNRIGQGYVSSAVVTDTAIYIQNDGLQKLSLKDFTNKKVRVSLPKPSADFKVKWVSESNEPNTLFIILDNTVYSFNTITNIAYKIATIPSDHLRGLYYDKDDNLLFVGSSGQGAFFIIPGKNGFVRLPLDAKKSLLFCHYILKDKEGDFWLVTNTGLIYMERKKFFDYLKGKTTEISYGYLASGTYAPGIEYNGGFTNSGLIEEDSIYLSSMSGLVKLNTKDLKRSFPYQTFKPILDGVQVNDSLLFDKELTLSPNYKTLQLNFSFPYIQYTGSYLEYRMLGGNDTSWITFLGNNLLLNNVKPGNYKIEVRSNGKVPSEILQIPLRIRAYWYYSWKGLLLFIVIAGLLSYIIFQARIQIIKNNSLKQINKNHEQLFQIIAHDLRSPINHYQGLSEVLQNLIQNKQYERLQIVGGEIENTSRKFEVLINNLMTWSLIQQKKMKLLNENILLSDIINDVLPMYTTMAESKDILVSTLIDKNVTVSVDKSVLSLIIRNLLDNAIKHAPSNSEIFITAQKEDSKAVFICRNTYKPGQRKYLMWLFSQMEEGGSMQAHNLVGFGLRFINEFIEMIQGSIEMSLDNEFATWRVVVPSYS